MILPDYGSDPTKYVSITAQDFEYNSISDIAENIKMDEYRNKFLQKLAARSEKRKVGCND